jgi:hypothetical protein
MEAIDKVKEFKLGSSDEALKITEGPNDWDLWLCLRKTKFQVTFLLDRAITIPPYIDPNTFFNGVVTLMEIAGDEIGQTVCWTLEGWVYKGNMRTNFVFKASYNTETKQGHIIFR